MYGRRSPDGLLALARPPRFAMASASFGEVQPTRCAGFWNALRREPVVHFAALSALLFLTYGALQPSEQEALVIERATLEQLEEEQAALLGRPLTEEERQSLIERAIDDAVLLREAYKRGLDQDAVVETASGAENARRPGRGGAGAERG